MSSRRLISPSSPRVSSLINNSPEKSSRLPSTSLTYSRTISLLPADDVIPTKRSRSTSVSCTVAAIISILLTSSLIFTTLLFCWANPSVQILRAGLNPLTENASNPVREAGRELPYVSSQERLALRRKARRNPKSWLQYLRKSSRTGRINTQRVGCREMQSGAQSCVFEGFTCINTSSARGAERPEVYFLADGEKNGEEARGDNWCGYRHQSADPRYYGPRHWPILEDTFSPQHSCLNAYYRSQRSLFGGGISNLKIKWYDSLWLIDLDYQQNPHNYHLLMDLIWVLDVVLWQKSVDLRRPPDDLASGMHHHGSGHLFSEGPEHLYLPQGEVDFTEQTKVDINRFIYSLILQRNLSKLYPDFNVLRMRRPSRDYRFTEPLLDVYPDLKRDDRLLFHSDLVVDSSVDLVCTPRFTSGAKIANGAHERVCRFMRQKSYEFFGIEEPEVQRLGMSNYPQPPKRLIILQRHISRGIANLQELQTEMRKIFSPYGVEVEVVSTEKLVTAEDHVRIFSRAGVLLTTHGSQSMSQIWMPRHSSLIEIMPVGYTDYTFQLLSESCKIWYYELQGKVSKSKLSDSISQALSLDSYYGAFVLEICNSSTMIEGNGPSNGDYERECAKKWPHLLNPCNEFKSGAVTVHVDQAINKVRFAFERMGHEVGPWLRTVNSGLWMS